MDQRMIDVANIGDVDVNTMDQRWIDGVEANTMDQRNIDVASTEDDVDANNIEDVEDVEEVSTGDGVDANTVDKQLIDVAKNGNIDAFYTLLGMDQCILERIDLFPFVDTPLHIAIKADKTAFAVEIANLKPSFARKLNQAGFSPIHLASECGNLKIVGELLDKDHDLCLLAGKGKRIPLHFAATAGRVDVIKALLKDCPDSIGMLTAREETPLHLAAKNGQLEACKVLVQSIKKLKRRELMDWKDEDGKTALDVAAESPLVLAWLEIENPALNRKALRAERRQRLKAWMERPITNDSRNAMLVVLAVIIATSFQAVVNPPGGVWQDTSDRNSTINANTTPAAATGSQPADYAGKAVMGKLYLRFVTLNTVGLCFSLTGIILLTYDLPFIFQILLMLCIVPMLMIYRTSIAIISPEKQYQRFLDVDFDLDFDFYVTNVATELTYIFIFLVFLLRLLRVLIK